MSYDELCQAILDAREELLKHKIEANTVILNGRKYGCLFEPGLRPSIFGMAVECDAAIPDRYDFIVQYREPKPQTNYDRLIAMNIDELAFELAADGCPTIYPECPAKKDPEGGHSNCVKCWLDWLKSPVEVEDG